MVKYYTLIVDTDRDLRRFIKLPLNIYRDYPKWIPPLIGEMQRKVNPEKNPFFEYGQVKMFGVFNEFHEMVGRIAAPISKLIDSNGETSNIAINAC